MSTHLRILILEDSAADAELIEEQLQAAGLAFTSRRVQTHADFLAALEGFAPTLILSDFAMPGFDGLSALVLAQATCPAVPFIFVSGALGEERAVAAMKQGATDYVIKHRLNQLPASVQRALREVEERRRHRQLAERYRHLFENAAEGIVQSTIDGRILTANPAAVRIWGYDSVDDLIYSVTNMAAQIYVNSSRRRELVQLLMERGEVHGFEALERRKDGSTVWVLLNARLVLDGQGEAAWIESVMQNIDERKKMEQALRDSQRQLAGIIASAMDAIISVNEKQEIVLFNQAAEQLFGYQAAEMLGQSLDHLLPERFRRAHRGHIQRFSQAGTTNRSMGSLGMIYGRRADGSEFPIEAAISQVQASGHTVYTVILRDVTERRQRERELEAIARVSASLRAANSQAEMLPLILDEVQELLEANAAALALRAPSGQVMTVNMARGEWAGQTGAPIAGTNTIAELVFKSGRPYHNNEIQTSPYFAGRELFSELQAVACVPLIVQQQTLGVLAIGCRAAISSEGVRLLATIGDMVANALYRTMLYEQTKEQARRVQQMIDTVPEGVLLLDTSYRVMMANPVAQTYLDVLYLAGPGEVLTTLGDRPVAELLQPIAPGTPWQEVVFADEQRIFEVAAGWLTKGILNEGWVLVLREVTEQRQQARYMQTQERLATVGQLAAGIAHDLNNVLASIILYAQMLSLGPNLPARQQERLNTIVAQAQHASRLIHQILDFSRSSILSRTAVDLLPFLRELVKLLERTLPENITVSLQYATGDFVANADLTRLQQVMMNLGVNARDAMPQGGRLGIRLELLQLSAEEKPPLPDMTPGQWIRFSVTDSGTGILPEHLPHLFEPFFTTKPAGQGTGLGLAQVYGIIKQHDGYIGVHSEVGVGTTFTMYLPLLSIPVPPIPKTVAAAPQSGNGETILVVEDEEQVRRALTEMLQMLNYRVVTAADGREALALYQTYPTKVDLVLSDMVMPDMGGAELYHSLKAADPTLKMIAITGYPLEEVGRELLGQGIVVGLQKPFEAEAIARLVRDALANG